MSRFDWRRHDQTAAEWQRLPPAEVAAYDAHLPELRRFVPVRFWWGWAVWDVQHGRLAGGTPTGTLWGRVDWWEQARAIELCG